MTGSSWKPTAATILSILMTGAAIVWRLAVLETHVEELRRETGELKATRETYVTKEILRLELRAMERRIER